MALSNVPRPSSLTTPDLEKHVYDIIRGRGGSATRKEISILIGDPFLTRRIFDHLLSQKRIRVSKGFGDGIVEIRYAIVEKPVAKNSEPPSSIKAD